MAIRHRPTTKAIVRYSPRTAVARVTTGFSEVTQAQRDLLAEVDSSRRQQAFAEIRARLECERSIEESAAQLATQRAEEIGKVLEQVEVQVP